MAREWNTPTREPWNPLIKTALDAVDRHNQLYFKSNNVKHLILAQLLRDYVTYLKDFITESEKV